MHNWTQSKIDIPIVWQRNGKKEHLNSVIYTLPHTNSVLILIVWWWYIPTWQAHNWIESKKNSSHSIGFMVTHECASTVNERQRQTEWKGATSSCKVSQLWNKYVMAKYVCCAKWGRRKIVVIISFSLSLAFSISADSALFGGGLLPEHTEVYSKIIVITIKCNTVSDKTNEMKRKWRATFGNVKCNHTQTTNANRGKRRRRRQQPTKVIRIQSKIWNVRLKK